MIDASGVYLYSGFQYMCRMVGRVRFPKHRIIACRFFFGCILKFIEHGQNVGLKVFLSSSRAWHTLAFSMQSARVVAARRVSSAWGIWAKHVTRCPLAQIYRSDADNCLIICVQTKIWAKVHRVEAGTHYGYFHEACAKRRVSSACYVRAKDVMQCLLAHIFVWPG